MNWTIEDRINYLESQHPLDLIDKFYSITYTSHDITYQGEVKKNRGLYRSMLDSGECECYFQAGLEWFAVERQVGDRTIHIVLESK